MTGTGEAVRYPCPHCDSTHALAELLDHLNSHTSSQFFPSGGRRDTPGSVSSLSPQTAGFFGRNSAMTRKEASNEDRCDVLD